MVAGIYGMNFDFMPELKFAWAYPLILLVTLAICLYLYKRFKGSGWL
jgi:magnesium transporter